MTHPNDTMSENNDMIVFDHVTKTFPGGTVAVNDLSLSVAAGETLVLLGTSGSGKTTSMKMVNRLIEPSGGTIYLNGEDIMTQNMIQLRRSIGYAIQHIGLFPHMTIADNIATVPRLLGWSKTDIIHRVDSLLELVGLYPNDYRNRFPHQLSGGQRQRIGVARALAADPPVILMDEPFGALDPITREQLQNEFLNLESELEKTILFVTHDVFEAVKMGDRIALLDEGQLQQLATPAELVEEPANQFVEDFLGAHRFQLSLLTRRVSSIISSPADTATPPAHKETKNAIDATMSLIDALDTFKSSKEKELNVWRGKKWCGTLSRSALLKAISDVIGEQTEAA